VIPKDSKNTHYEGELVLVIGKRASRISVADAPGVIFGVTCGNDVSERDWQAGPQKDPAVVAGPKAPTRSDRWAPAIVTGLDYGKLLLQTRLNGEVCRSR